MLSDTVISNSVGCGIKWLYNSARRLGRPILRTESDTIWWRLLYQIGSGFHAPISEAANAADMLQALGGDAERVRVSVSADGALAMSIDLGRFHDGAALALAKALHCAVPGKRGRPPKLRKQPTLAWGASPALTLDVKGVRLRQGILALAGSHNVSTEVFLRLFADLERCGAAPVLVGELAALCHGFRDDAATPHFVCDFSETSLHDVVATLNALAARPRGVSSRAGFRLTPASVASVEYLALNVAGLAVDVSGTLPPLGEHSSLLQRVERIAVGDTTCAVLSASALRETAIRQPA